MAGEVASRIGANFSDYQGNANLGGGSDGVYQIDTKPLEMLAQYSFAYHSKLYDQQQKDLEAQAKEAADFAAYDLTNAIPKYAKVLRDQYDETFNWIQQHPDVIDYKKNPEGFLEYKKRLNDLKNNIKDGASQEIINTAFQKTIDAETRPEVIASLEKQRKEQIDANDIRTPIKFQQYGAEPTVYPTVPVKEFDVIRKDANGDMITDRALGVADQHFINVQAGVIALDLQKETLDVNSEAFKALPPEVQKLKKDQNERSKATGRTAIVDEARIMTEALQQYKDPATGKIDMERVKKSPLITSGTIAAVDAYNQQMRDEKAKINSGYYSDNLGVLKFGQGALDEKDYEEIDYTDGEISPTDLAKVNLRAKAPATTYKTDAKELSNATSLKKEEMGNATTRRGQDIAAATARRGQDMDLIAKGWTRDAKGKLVAPKKDALTAAGNGGIVPYWQNYILPQITSKSGDILSKTSSTGMWWWKKDTTEKLPVDYTGDVEVATDKISGLSVALFGEKTADGKQKGISGHGDDPTAMSLRFEAGNPVGVVIDGVFYDQNDINSKATSMQDKAVSTKLDSPVFDANTVKPAPPTPPKKDPLGLF